jgi:hypothetical protein
MNNEEWLPIKDYEGLYEVSSLGRVRSLERLANVRGGGVRVVQERILKPSVSKGYQRYTLQSKDKPKIFFGHRLVANAFVWNPHKKPWVNHVDFDRQNNKPHNLEWVTSVENIRHSTNAGHYSGMNNHNFSAVWTVEKIREAVTMIPTHSTRDISKCLGVSTSSVKRLKRNTVAHATN